MEKENFDLRFILLIAAIIIGLIALIWAGVLTAKISSFDQKISETQTSVASMTSYMASTTSVLSMQMAKLERSMTTQQATVASLTAYVRNMYTDLAGKISSEDQKIANTQSNITSLTNQVGSLISNLQSLSASSQTSQPVSSQTQSQSGFMALISSSTQSISSNVTLTTTTSTSLSAVNAMLSGINTYEIAQENGLYYVAYPGKGVTYSIQILSSPYPDRVLALVKSLRNLGIPAFKIDYSTQSALFIGVFTGYTPALNYANSITSNPNVTSMIGTVSSWLIRTIP
ncbi:MAG: hypothetical protein M1542_08050 [Thermotogae bacterium]|jgi:hypothetical protein|nr:hypothetical protein [Thermotogota bacterium]MCL5033178.1 hypothetical protein [Thermotogota bacterium]